MSKEAVEEAVEEAEPAKPASNARRMADGTFVKDTKEYQKIKKERTK